MADQTRITVLAGRPDEEELASVTAVLLALRGLAGQAVRAAPPAPPPARADWSCGPRGHRPAVSWSGRS